MFSIVYNICSSLYFGMVSNLHASVALPLSLMHNSLCFIEKSDFPSRG